jgi:pimeloyl-ACP methyl ester carboxylesterase
MGIRDGSATTTTTTATLTLNDGCKITYTSIGDTSNPLLLLVVGSSGIGSLYSKIAKELSRHFRCVYYDKRGFLPIVSDHVWAARQRNEVVSVEKQADDAAMLIKHLSPSTPAYVFGTSCGATGVLDLTIRHTDLVHTAILHEPITFSVIRDGKLRNEMLELYKRVGNAKDTVEGHTVFRKYMFNPPQDAGRTIMTASPPSAPRNAVDLFNSRGGQCEALAMIDYKVDEQRAKAVRDKFLIVAGKDSAHLQVSRPGFALAYMLGENYPLWILPGDHISFASKSIAKKFCEELLVALQHAGRASFLDHPEGRAML